MAIVLEKAPVIKNFTKEEVKSAQGNTSSQVEIATIDNGYPTFNTCAHTTIDLSGIGGDNYQRTLSIKLPNGRHVTMCVMQLGETQNCIDVQYYQDGQYANKNEKVSTKVCGFKDGSMKYIEDMGLYAVIVDAKGGN